MRPKVVKLGLSKLTIPEKVELGRRVVTACTGNPVFSTPIPPLSDITSVSDVLEQAYNAAQGGGVAETSYMHEREREFDVYITAFGNYVNSIAKGVETIIYSAGLDASKDPEPTGVPAQVTGLEAKFTDKKGEVKLRWNKVPHALLYRVLRKKDLPGEDYAEAAQVSAARHLFTGLESLQGYWFKVVAIGRGGLTGPDSDPASSIAL
jgi:hypothetical protein